MSQPVKLAAEEGPEQGHTFRIVVVCRGAYTVVGDERAHDSAEFDLDLPWEVEVREHSLSAALAKAAQLPLGAWTFDYEVDQDLEVPDE